MSADASLRQYRYQVALSFAGEDREYVERVAGELRSRGVSVFYDRYERASLWGKNLYDHLTRIYKNDAQFTIIFVSAAYAKKVWTNRERESAQARALEESAEYILPARFDDTQIPGLLRTTGYIDLRHLEPKELVDLIAEKLGHVRTHAFDATRIGEISVNAIDIDRANVERRQIEHHSSTSLPDPLVVAALAQLSEHSDIHSAVCDAILATEHAPSGLLDLLLHAVRPSHARSTFGKFAVRCIDKFNIGYEAIDQCLSPGALGPDGLEQLGFSMRVVTREPVIDWAHEKLTKHIRSDAAYYNFLLAHRDFVLSRHAASMAGYLLVPDRGPAGNNVDSLFLVAKAAHAPQPYVRRLREWILGGRFDGPSRAEAGEKAEVLYAYLNSVHELSRDHPLRELSQLNCARVCSLLRSPTDKVVGLYHLYAMWQKQFVDVRLVADRVIDMNAEHMSDDERELFQLLIHPMEDEARMGEVAAQLANRVAVFG